MREILGALRRSVFVRATVGRLYVWWQARHFATSEAYWQRRYSRGLTSGDGSYGKLAHFKAEVINRWFLEYNMTDAIEFGCGDGHQLLLMHYPKYLGFDISEDALSLCRRRFAGDGTRDFAHVDTYDGSRACTALSLDVIYHLVEDEVFEAYMHRLFNAAEQWVIVYSSNHDRQDALQSPHVRHRLFTGWVEKHLPQWELLRQVTNPYPECGDPREGSSADMFLYRRKR